MRPEPLDESNLYLFHEGTQTRAYKLLGAHREIREGRRGIRFAVWAPRAQDIWVVGDFNDWHGEGFRMEPLGASGIWSLFVPDIGEGTFYKFAVRSESGEVFVKSDPFAFSSELRPNTASRVTGLDGFEWTDSSWRKKQEKRNIYSSPLNIYEAHLGSWRRKADGELMSYRDLAFELVDYVVDMGYTHIELMPVAEHPLDASWGYQQIGYYSATSRYGLPQDFMFFVNRAHEKGLGVIVDWVPGHFCRDAHGLARFDGEPLFESAKQLRAENQQWGTLNFDFKKPEVRSFLLSNAMFWFDVFHVDGLRVDAVASLIYLDFGKENAAWLPNRYGGRENVEAIEFLRHLNMEIFREFPAALMIAEESTEWAGVTRPVYEGGLGFNYKWNMGWMNDMLRYVKLDPLFRKGSHTLVTFAMMYAYSENFILPLSHDEVVHEKKSLVDKMPGDYWQKFAGLRGFFGFMMAHPGKKLLFMGGEFAQFIEWNEGGSLDWHLLGYEKHAQMHAYVKDLNHFYLQTTSLWEQDHHRSGFRWIDPDDADAGVVSFLRFGKTKDDFTVVVCNFTPIGRESYSIGVPKPGEYHEVLNSDALAYGGSGQHHQDSLLTIAEPRKGLPCTLLIGVPPLAVLYLQYGEVKAR